MLSVRSASRKGEKRKGRGEAIYCFIAFEPFGKGEKKKEEKKGRYRRGRPGEGKGRLALSVIPYTR